MSRIPLWIDLRHVPVNKRLPYLHAIDETAVQEVVLAKDDAHHGRAGLRTVTVDGNGAIKRHKQPIGKWVNVRDAKSAQKAATTDGVTVVDATDWRVIPLENLVAQRQDRPGTLFALARSPEQALLFARTLETGVHGIVLAPSDAQAIFATDQALRSAWVPPAAPLTVAQAVAHPGHAPHTAPAAFVTPPASQQLTPPFASPPAQPGPPLQHGAPMPPTPPAQPASPTVATTQAPALASPSGATAAHAEPVRVLSAPLVRAPPGPGPALVPAQVVALEDAGMGDRVCVDTTSLLRDGEGLLVGSTAASFALVHAETLRSEFIATRPFRVNAGAVHSYLLGPDGTTRYLSELAAGHQVQAVHADGTQRILTVGRVKVERRPHLLVRWRSDAGAVGHAMLQHAETVRLVDPNGQPVSVTDLRPGQRILVHDESAARHAGHPVQERLEER